MQTDVFLFSLLIVVFCFFMMMFISIGIKVFKEYERAVILRLGKFSKIVGPGIIWKMPILDRIGAVFDLRKKVLTIPVGVIETEKEFGRGIEVQITYRITDVEKAYLSVENIEGAIIQIIQHEVHKIVESAVLDIYFDDHDAIDDVIMNRIVDPLSKMGISIEDVSARKFDS